jgi:hypothetical protein
MPPCKEKDRLGDQRGGEWMGADKNSSRRMNLAYAPNPQPRIPTRTCQGRVVRKDLPTLGTSPKPIQRGSTTQKARDLGNLESTTWTVRSVRADCPRGGHGPSEIATRTSSTAPRKTDRLWWTRGPSASSRTVRHSSTDRPQTSCTKNPPTKWIEREALKNPQEHEEQLGCQAPRERSAVTSRTVHQVRISTAEEHEKQPQTSNRMISQTTRSLETKFWW